MTQQAIAVTHDYRHKVALAAANGTAVPRAAFMAFGSGSRPYAPETDTALEAEFVRVPTTNSVTGPELTVSAVLTGTAAAGHTLREVGVFAADGTLMGRRVLAPKAFEPDTGFELDIIFEY
ncbi:MAG: phage tail protein [Laribacter sp.]|nr:phage tail protein [Laribacter sp.]MBP9608450.1 phage tail protein [Laribacter sp.]